MNDEIKKQFANKALEILTQVQTAVGQAKDLAVEQVPEIAIEYVKYSIVYHGLLVAFSVFLFILVIYSVIRLHKNYETEAAIPVGVFGSFISAVIFSVNIEPLLLAYFAPKVFIIKELISIVK